MPFGYVSPEQAMRDKADYARKGVARGSSCVALQYTGGILMVTPNVSRALHKLGELYDRIGFAAVGRYHEYETLRKAGVTYADMTGYQFDRMDVTARGIANWYAQNLGEIFTASLKPFEAEIVVAEVGETPDSDQIYRITFDGVVSDEPGFVAFGGQVGQVAEVLKERFSDGMSLPEALGAALDALAAPSSSSSSSSSSSGNGQPAAELTAGKLEVAILDRARSHRTFRRLRGARLEELLAESRPSSSSSSADGSGSGAGGSGSEASGSGSGPGAPGGSGSSGSGSGGSAGSRSSGSGVSGSGSSGSASSGSSASGSSGSSGSSASSGGSAASGGSASSGSRSSGSSGTGSSGSGSGSSRSRPPKSGSPGDEPPTGPAAGGGDGIPRPGK